MTMPNEVVAPIDGLGSNRNEISTQPGPAIDACNVVFAKPGVAERRRGFDATAGNARGLLTGLSGSAQQFIETDKGDLYLHKGIRLYADSNDVDQNWNSLQVADGFQPAPQALCCKISVDNGKLYFAQNAAIWVLDQAAATVSLLAGLPGTTGTTNGTGSAARFSSSITGMCFDTTGTDLYVSDSGNHTIRKVTLAGVVTLVAGNAGVTGSADGTGAAASFNSPRGIVAVNATNFYVCDYSNHTIRNVTTGGVVTTPYGSAGVSATTDGTGGASRFSNPQDICFDETNCWVVQPASSNIRKIVVTSQAVSTPVSLLGAPTGCAVKDGRLLFVDTGVIQSYPTAGGSVTQPISSTDMTAAFGSPALLACDNGGYSPLGAWYVASNKAIGVIEKHGTSNDGFCAFHVLAKSYATPGSGNPNVSVLAPNCIVAPDSVPTMDGGTANTQPSMGVRIRSADVAQSTYFTTNRGVRKIDSVFSVDSDLGTGSIVARSAGVPRALAPTLSLSSSSPTLLANGYQRAYRVCWSRKDANKYLQTGSPSERVLIQNSAGATRDVSMAIPIPSDISTSDFYQVFATEIVSNTLEAGDECALVREAFPTESEIASGVLTYVDIAPDAVRGEVLYTSQSQEGSFGSNDRPPLARDLCEYRGHMFYADFTDKHRLILQMIGVGTLVAGTSKITIGGVVFNCEAAESVSAGNFLLYTGGTASQNIENTSRSLCRVVNGYRANTSFYAWYESSYDGAPGTILIEERVVGGSAITVTANNAACGNAFSPPIPPGNGAPATLSSEADRGKARIRVSKQGEPEACPIYRDILVGSEDDRIHRVIALRDSVVVIKERSIWRIVGSYFDDFTAVRIDDTVTSISRESAAKLNNNVIFLSSDGFVAVSENGVVNLSLAERQRHQCIARLAWESPELAIAAVNNAQQVYLCAVPAIDIQSIGQFDGLLCWSASGNSWSRWSVDGAEQGLGGAKPLAIGCRRSTIYWAMDENYTPVMRQRAITDITSDEFADLTRVVTFTYGNLENGKQRITNFAVNVSALISPATTGFGYGDYGWGYAISSPSRCVISKDTDGYYLTAGAGLTSVVGTPGVASGNLSAASPIPVVMSFAVNGGNPAAVKQFTEGVAYVGESQMHDMHIETVGPNDFRYTPNSYLFGASDQGTIDTTVTPNERAIAYANNFQSYHDFYDNLDTDVGRYYELRGLRFFLDKAKQTGEWIALRFYQSTALCRFEFKGFVLGVRPISTNRVRQ